MPGVGNSELCLDSRGDITQSFGLPTSDCTKVFRKFVLAAAVVVDFAGVWVFPVAVGVTLQQAASSTWAGILTTGYLDLLLTLYLSTVSETQWHPVCILWILAHVLGLQSSPAVLLAENSRYRNQLGTCSDWRSPKCLVPATSSFELLQIQLATEFPRAVCKIRS